MGEHETIQSLAEGGSSMASITFTLLGSILFVWFILKACRY